MSYTRLTRQALDEIERRHIEKFTSFFEKVRLFKDEYFDMFRNHEYFTQSTISDESLEDAYQMFLVDFITSQLFFLLSSLRHETASFFEGDPENDISVDEKAARALLAVVDYNRGYKTPTQSMKAISLFENLGNFDPLKVLCFAEVCQRNFERNEIFPRFTEFLMHGEDMRDSETRLQSHLRSCALQNIEEVVETLRISEICSNTQDNESEDGDNDNNDNNDNNNESSAESFVSDSNGELNSGNNSKSNQNLSLYEDEDCDDDYFNKHRDFSDSSDQENETSRGDDDESIIRGSSEEEEEEEEEEDEQPQMREFQNQAIVIQNQLQFRQYLREIFLRFDQARMDNLDEDFSPYINGIFDEFSANSYAEMNRDIRKQIEDLCEFLSTYPNEGSSNSHSGETTTGETENFKTYRLMDPSLNFYIVEKRNENVFYHAFESKDDEEAFDKVGKELSEMYPEDFCDVEASNEENDAL